MRNFRVCNIVLLGLILGRALGCEGKVLNFDKTTSYAKASPIIEEINDLKSVEDTLIELTRDQRRQLKREQILVVFDVDQTLLTSGGEEYCRFLKKKQHFVFWVPPSYHTRSATDSYVDLNNRLVEYHEHRGFDEHEDDDDPLLYIKQSRGQVIYFDSRSNHVGSYRWMHATQSDASEIIENLKKNAYVVALTARYPIAESRTLQQLSLNEISFEASSFTMRRAERLLRRFRPVGHQDLGLAAHFGVSVVLHIDTSLFNGWRSFNEETALNFIWPTSLADWQLLGESSQEFIVLPPEKLLTPTLAKFKGLPPHNRSYTFSQTMVPSTAVVSYHKGVIHSADNDKGLVLRHLLAGNPHHTFTHIVFVDDIKDNLMDMYAAFADEPNVELSLFHYTRALHSPCGYPERWELPLPAAVQSEEGRAEPSVGGRRSLN